MKILILVLLISFYSRTLETMACSSRNSEEEIRDRLNRLSLHVKALEHIEQVSEILKELGDSECSTPTFPFEPNAPNTPEEADTDDGLSQTSVKTAPPYYSGLKLSEILNSKLGLTLLFKPGIFKDNKTKNDRLETNRTQEELQS